MTGTHPQNRRLGYARVSTYGQKQRPDDDQCGDVERRLCGL